MQSMYAAMYSCVFEMAVTYFLRFDFYENQ